MTRCSAVDALISMFMCFQMKLQVSKMTPHIPRCMVVDNDCLWLVNSPHKWPITRKCFHLMTPSWISRVSVVLLWLECTSMQKASVASRICSPRGSRPGNCKETNGLPTPQSLANMACLLAVTRYELWNTVHIVSLAESAWWLLMTLRLFMTLNCTNQKKITAIDLRRFVYNSTFPAR